MEKVPDVTDIFYTNACNILAENDLRFNLEDDDGTMVVVGQNPKAGEIVFKGSPVLLEIRELTEDEKRLQKFYGKYADRDLVDIEITLHSKEIEVSDGSYSMFFGDILPYTEDMELYLENEA